MLNHHVLNIKTPGKILKHVIYVSGGTRFQKCITEHINKLNSRFPKYQ